MADFYGKLIGQFISPMDPNGNKVQQMIIHDFLSFFRCSMLLYLPTSTTKTT